MTNRIKYDHIANILQSKYNLLEKQNKVSLSEYVDVNHIFIFFVHVLNSNQ